MWTGLGVQLGLICWSILLAYKALSCSRIVFSSVFCSAAIKGYGISTMAFSGSLSRFGFLCRDTNREQCVILPQLGELGGTVLGTDVAFPDRSSGVGHGATG